MEPGREDVIRPRLSVTGRCALALFAALLAACSPDLSPLVPVPIPDEIRIADSEPQDLRIEAPPASPIWITVAARDVDVKAAIVATGVPLRYCDAPNRRMGIETLLIEPPHEGAVALRVQRNDHAKASGEAIVVAVALPLATEADRQRLIAVRKDAGACEAFPDPALKDQAATAYAAAAEAWGKAGDRRRRGLSLLHASGVRYLRHADWRASADLASKAFDLLEHADAAAYSAYALRLEGSALDQLANATDYELGLRAGTVRRARERLAQAARQFNELGMPYEEGYALSYRAVSLVEAGEPDQGRREFVAALDQFRMAGDEPAQAVVLQSLALQSYEDGRSADSALEFREALALLPRDEELANYAHTLQNSALPLRILGRFDEAIARELESAEIFRKLDDRDGEARALHGMAIDMMYFGENERAAELMREAIGLRGATGVRREQVISLINLAELERQSGRLDAALALDREALELVVAPNDRARVLLSLARDHLAAGDLNEAWKFLNSVLALELPPTHRFLGLALSELATVESLESRGRASDELFARAIAIHAANGSDVDQAQTLARRAETRLKRGDVAGALTDSVTALEMFEGIGVQSLQAETRAAFRASYRDTVELRIAALLAQADAVRADDAAQAESLLRAAFAASDRSRAQLLAESAGPSGTVVSGELLAERQRTYELLIAKRQQRDRLLDTADPNQERAENLAREIELLRAQARLIEGRIASREPVFAARGARTPETVFDAVPPGTLVAEYFLGHKQSWLFEVRDEGIRVHVLGPSDDIDRLARELHLSWRRAAHDGSDRLAPARRLSRLLYGPLGYAASAGGIWIVPDGALHLVPMALLAAQTWSGFAPGAAVVIPSLSSLARATQTDPAPPYRLAVIADPVYSADDPRIREVARKAAVAGTSRPVTANSAGDELRRLPSTAIEARDLVALVDDPAQTLALLGPNASRESVSQAPLDRYQFVHFAAHARADSRDPALAMLALSNWSADGEPIVGTLRVYDITRLRLNADLVVLSACDTALGRVIAGEGPIGLSHAFLRSGARAVLATLWQVPDTSTAVLMREFYRQMLENGRPPPVALAVAQAQLRGQTRWQDPYFWAGFQLVTNARLDALNNKDVAGREES